MDNWWKSPVLQGPENDYGQYDYMIEELPQDKAGWEFATYERRCDCCGKYKMGFFYCSEHYFHTLDGWDSLSFDECWICIVKDIIHSRKRKINRTLRATKFALKCMIEDKRYDVKYFKLLYKIALK